MTEYVESKTLQALMARADRLLSRYHSTTLVHSLILRSALQAREQLGLRKYGKTLDDQVGYDVRFWLRMMRDEVLDALMYAQKVTEAWGASDQTLTDDLAAAYTTRGELDGLVKLACHLIEAADPDTLQAFVPPTPRPDLFPPAELRKEPHAT